LYTLEFIISQRNILSIIVTEFYCVCLFIGKVKLIKTADPIPLPSQQPNYYIPASACYGDYSGGGYSGGVGSGSNDD
jgi:hypothetical protein